MVELFALIRQYRNGLVAILVLIVALVLMLSVRSHGTGQNDLVNEVVLDIVGPVQRLVLSPITLYRQAQTRITQLKHLDSENRRMEVELASLRHLDSKLEELSQENQRLRRLLEIPVNHTYRRISTQVVGDTSSAFASSMIISAGRTQGVVANATVVVPEGLLGRVVKVGSHTSLVLSLLDLNSRIPVVVQRTRDRGIAAGTNKRMLRLEFVSKEADVRVDDLIVTSGTGEGFPKGLVVGRVQGLASEGSGLFRKVTVMPVVDFNRIEEVTLLLPWAIAEEDKALMSDTVPISEP